MQLEGKESFMACWLIDRRSWIVFCGFQLVRKMYFVIPGFHLLTHRLCRVLYQSWLGISRFVIHAS